MFNSHLSSSIVGCTIRLFLYAAISSLFASCIGATFFNYTNKGKHSYSESPADLQGKYHVAARYFINEKDTNVSKVPRGMVVPKDTSKKAYWFPSHNMYEMITEKDYPYDTLRSYAVELTLVSKKKFMLKLTEDHHVVDSVPVVLRKRSSGFHRLKQHNDYCWGLPMILGGCCYRNIRLGKTEKGDLLLDDKHTHMGAALLLIMEGYGQDHLDLYERIE